MRKDFVYVEDLKDHVGKEVELAGWLYNKRSSGKIWFLMLRDGTGIVQGIVNKKEVSEEIYNIQEKLSQESSLFVKGIVNKDDRAPGGYELWIRDIRINQIAEEYPISLKEHGTEFLMDHRHLWLRSKMQTAILRIRHEVVRSIRDFFDDRGFTLVDAPIFTPNACEGTTTLFETEYFGSKAYLTQSGQLYMEAGAMALGKVYCFGPTFRAEKSKTRRHLTEFWMVEPEVAFADLNDNMDLAEEFLEYVVQRVLEKKSEELKVVERDTTQLEKVKRPFPRISYDEAVDILKKKEVAFEVGGDFGGTDETIISEQFDRPLIVHRYPAAVKAFYMKADPEDKTKSLSMDILAPEGYGEIIGGGEREDSYEVIIQKLHEHNLSQEDFKWYLDLRKYGTVPHSGFGLGIERTVSYISGLKHIRETIPFPRTIYRNYP
ncbi:asparagine--tRNA ligase [candidate division KSB1 bacterium]|nr:asparagine--tRNA ligase [candidate division KSB1 bacterium]